MGYRLENDDKRTEDKTRYLFSSNYTNSPPPLREWKPNPEDDVGQVPELASRLTPNVENLAPTKGQTNRPPTKRNALDAGQTLKTQSGQQKTDIPFNNKTHMVLWNSAVGLCKVVKSTHNPTSPE